MPLPVIDLFAGPGGLGEGFTALQRGGKPAFKIKLSIEKDALAHKTLLLRAFFRQFEHRRQPSAYYAYLGGKISRDELFEKFPQEADNAYTEAWCAELGGAEFPSKMIDDKIRTALRGDDNWVLIGGPPCQAYSLVGRSRIIGEKGVAKYEADHRHFLYREYLRIIAAHHPPVFIMENVKGLLSAKVKEVRIFDRILDDLKSPSSAMPEFSKKAVDYDLFALAPRDPQLLEELLPADFVIRAENHGIPQARHRLIILGVRRGQKRTVKPGMLRRAKLSTAEDAIGDLPPLRSGLSKEPDSLDNWRRAITELVDQPWIHEVTMEGKLRQAIFKELKNVRRRVDRGSSFVSLKKNAKPPVWYRDSRLSGVCNHESRGHIRMDLHRYFFAAVFAQVYGRSPVLKDFPMGLLPKHKNVGEALISSKFNDRFRVQVANRPSTTVVSHISQDGHSFIHYDPSQCRSLTVREAARLQTFPDNYLFEGPRTQQYKQVGNAVPPLLAYKIAEIVADLFP